MTSPSPTAPDDTGSRAHRLGCLVLVILAVSLFADLPYRLAHHDPEFLGSISTRPPDTEAVYPCILAAEDYPQYLAAIREASERGDLLSRNPFSSEPHDRIVLRPFYSVVGFAAGVAGVSAETAYRLAVHLGRIVFLLGAYAFVSTFFAASRLRWLAFVTVVFVSGLTGWLSILQASLPDAFVFRYREGVERTEFQSFLLLFHHPHLPFAMGMTLFAARTVAGILARPRATGALWLALQMFAISVANLFSLVPVGMAAGIAAAVGMLRRRPDAAIALGWIAAGGLAGVPFLFYAMLTYSADPFWSNTYGLASGQGTPAPDVVVFQILWLVMFALAGVSSFARGQGAPSGDGFERSRAAAARGLVAVWIPATVVAMYLPMLDFRIRVAFGLAPMLAVVAACGIRDLLAAIGSIGGTAARRITAVVLVVVIGATPGYWWTLFVRSVSGEYADFYKLLYRPAAEVEGAHRLAELVGPDDVVLSSYESGNVLGGILDGAVVLGHDSGTLDSLRKRELVHRFFTGAMPRAEAEQFLAEERVSYVYFGPFEQRAFGAFDPTPLGDRFELAVETPMLRVLRVVGRRP